MEDLLAKFQIFGLDWYLTYTTEKQNRNLPQFDLFSKKIYCSQTNQIISAELSHKINTKSHLIHGLCSVLNTILSCMKDNKLLYTL